MNSDLLQYIIQMQKDRGKPVLSDSMTGLDRLFQRAPLLQQYQNLDPRKAAIDRIMQNIIQQQALQYRKM